MITAPTKLSPNDCAVCARVSSLVASSFGNEGLFYVRHGKYSAEQQKRTILPKFSSTFISNEDTQSGILKFWAKLFVFAILQFCSLLSIMKDFVLSGECPFFFSIFGF